ncbi:MAG: hypothetical protein B6D46_02850 [Polyangiaceae bacterium UTPRO1]|jgi:translocation and assembly module TamB|nr:translocation/assembly module TamB [Myxococcales bacterium]OQY68599.1 MAG: hypothetical protein B6D46_02850 [Polyangiaceae bacterium UTPRO1]
MAIGVRRWARIVLVLGVGAGAMLAVLAALSQTASFRDRLRRVVLARVNAELNGRLTIGALDGGLLAGMVIRDLRLVHEGRRVLAVRRLAATYDLLAFVRGRGLRITSLVADGVALALVADERGWNIERLLAAPHGEPSTLVVDIDAVRVTAGALRVERPGRGARLRDVTFAGAAHAGPHAARIAIDALAFRELGSGVRVDEASGRIAEEGGEWTLADLRLRTAGSALAADGRLGSVVQGTLRVERLAAADARALLRSPRSRADWRGEVHAAGRRDAVAVGGTFAAEVAAADGRRAAGSFAVEGTLDLDSAAPAGSVRAELAHVDLAGLAGESLPTTDLSGGVTVTVAPGAADVVDVGLDLGASRLGALALATATGTARVAADGLRFAVTAASAAGSARASGELAWNPPRFAVDLAASDLDLGAVLERRELAGRVNGSARLAGTGLRLAKMRADAALALTPSRIGGVAVAGADVALGIDAGRVGIERLDVAADIGTFTAAGAAVVEGGLAAATGEVRAEARITDLAPLATLLGRPGLHGAATVNAAVRGSGAAFDADVGLVGKDVAGAGWRIAGLDATLSGRGCGSGAAAVAVRGTARALEIGGRRMSELDLDAGGRGTLADFRGEIALRGHEPGGAAPELRAEVARRGGTTRATLATLRFTYGDTVWAAVGAPTFELRDERLTIADLVVRSRDGTLRAGGVLAAAGSDLEVGVEGFELGALVGLVPAGVRGRLAGRAHLGGTFAAPRVDADAVVAAPTLGGTRYDELRARLVVAAGRGELHARLAQAAQALVVDAAAPLTPAAPPFDFRLGEPEVRVRADGIDLAFVDVLWPGLVAKVGGTLAADVRVAGPIAAPAAHGTIALSGGRAYLVPLGVTYDAVDAIVRLEGRVASIDRLAIRSGKGSVTGGGTARFEGEGATMDARFEAKQFPLFANEYGHGVASGWLWISGTTAAPVLEGALETDGLVLRAPETLPDTVRPLDPTIVVVGPGAPAPSPAASAPPPPRVPSLFERAAVTVQLAVPRDAWVRRSDANVELEGWITAWKKPGEELHLAGDIRGVRGWYAFQGKKFALEEGSVRFSGQGFDPVLDITATHAAGEYLVRLKVGGTITKPTLALESEPALDQADVLSVLLFGAPAAQLSHSQSVGLRERALGIAGGYVASELRESVANALGVDDLQFDTGPTGLQDARVSVGKYVADDIFVSLAHRFGQSVEEVRIEYVIRPGWSLETSTDTLGRSAVDLLWKRRY